MAESRNLRYLSSLAQESGGQRERLTCVLSEELEKPLQIEASCFRMRESVERLTGR
jgi:hypothetical protein